MSQEDKFKNWRLCSQLDIPQAALLIIGEDPGDYPDICQATPGETPPGYDAASSALKAAISSGDLISLGVNHRSEILSFDDIKNWLEDNGRFDTFFSSSGTKTGNDQQVQNTELLKEVGRLQAENRNLKELSQNLKTNHPCKDNERTDYAPELALALELWEALYLNNQKPEYLPHTTASENWLKEKHPNLGGNAKKRLCALTNPVKNKNDQQEK